MGLEDVVVDLGIIGLARAGKTSLFNAATQRRAMVGAYSAQDQPNVGVVQVPDERLSALAAVFSPERVTSAEIRWVDYPTAGFGTGGPPASFLSELASMDALVHVVRAFSDETVPHPNGAIDPDRDVDTLNLELAFADLALIERRLERIESEGRSVPLAERGDLERDRALLLMLQGVLEQGNGVRSMDLSEGDRKHLAQYQFVTRRPLLLVVNVGEDDEAIDVESRFGSQYSARFVEVVALAAKMEAELADLEPEDRVKFRHELGLDQDSPLNRAIRTAYEMLGLVSFFTVGDDECRAWTLPGGSTALDAAAVIHSDLERGFIRAEVASWDQFVKVGSIANLRQQGALRVEGRSYVIQDGDVVHILFNV